MAPLIPSAKVTLSYPLFACAFDPLDSTKLVVGGGGGAGRSGVGNRITLLDASNPSELAEAGEADLSKDEDSVMSLAVGQRKGKATLVYAGINASPADVEKGNNTHFRVFGIEATGAKGKGKGKASSQKLVNKITELSRASLFKGADKDTYQRITRLSRLYPSQPQLGAVATGLAKSSEVVLFDTSSTAPPKPRGALQIEKEAVDMDFLQTGQGEYLFAYCDDHDIYLKKISAKADNVSPECIYITPASRSGEAVTLPTFRAMRWLTKDFLVMLTNIHSNGGVVVQILRVPPSGKGQCRIAQSHRLPDGLKKATGMAVSNLTPPASPTAPQGYTQFVIAVAGQDISISLFKVDLQVESGISKVTGIQPFRVLKDVHPLQITGLAFSNFTPPAQPVTASTPLQNLKLASVGISNTVVVHTLPLFPVPFSVKRGQSKTPRYVIALPSSAAVAGFGVILSILILLVAIITQGILEVRGGAPNYLNARNHVPVAWQESLGRPYDFPGGYNRINTAPGPALHLPEFFDKIKSGKSDAVYVLRDVGDRVGAEVHDEDVHGEAKTWAGLSEAQKKAWRKKLKGIGQDVEGLGETLLKGVVFGELAGAVGDMVR